jgi:uncharacterized membrane protein YphA (DoxX/SURF4 family)
MTTVLWILTSILAALFLGSGLVKAVQPKSKLVKMEQMAWANDFSPGTLKFIGIAEILAAIGLTLPAAVGVAPILVPVAATGLAVIMIGAIIVHARRNAPPAVGINVVLLALAATVAVTRFGPYAF